MKHNFEVVILAVLIAVAFSTIGRAAETSTSLTVPASPTELKPSMSTTISPPTSEQILDKLYFNVFSNYHGNGLNDLGSAYTVDRTGKVSKTLKSNFDSELTTAYMINGDIGVGPDIPFLLVPGPGQHFIMGDAGIKAFDRKTVSGYGFNLYTNLIVQAPTSDYSKDRKMDLALKTTPNVRYNVAHTNFTLGAWTEAKAYLGVISGKTFKLYAAPYVSYSLSDRFALNLEYEMEAHHYLGKPTLDFTNYQTDLEPGFVLNITKRILINPYLQIFTGNKVTFENTALGAIISATLL